MAGKFSRSKEIRTPLMTIAYSRNLFEARESDDGSKSFGCSLIMPKNGPWKPIQDIVLEAIEAQWGDKARQWFKDGVIKSPLLDGDGPQAINKKTGDRSVGFAGNNFIRLKSGEEFPPVVFDRKMVPIHNDMQCPSGSKVLAVINAYTWDNDKSGKGVSFGLHYVQVYQVAVGDEILGGGRPDPTNFLGVIEDSGDAPDVTKTGAGADGLFG
jgi:hypothetical protein